MRRRHAAATELILAVAACLLLAGPSMAQPKLDPSTQLRVDVPTTQGSSVMEFMVVFTMEQDSQAYLKVSPRPGNPVFGNGTAGGEGWWTEVVLEGPAGTLYEGRTAGDPPMDFGDLKANTTYTLHLRAHAPAGTLAQPTNYTLDYILAEHVTSTSEGSGGTLDESVGLHAVVRVQGEAAAQEDAFGIPLWAWGALALGVFVIAGVVLVAVVASKRSRRDQGPGPQE